LVAVTEPVNPANADVVVSIKTNAVKKCFILFPYFINIILPK